MEFQTLSTPSLKELFVNTIQNDILTGTLKVGDKLPSEREFSEQMQVSRAVINAGLKELKERGFIKVVPRQGTYVADYYSYGNLETLNAILDFREETIDFTDNSIRSFLEYRKLTDHLVSEGIVKHATAEEMKSLEYRMDLLQQADGIEATVQAAFDYYHEFCQISHDLILPMVMMSFELPITNLWTRYCTLYGPQALIQSLRDVYEPIMHRDLEGALKAADDNLNRSISGDRPVYGVNLKQTKA